MTKPVTLSDPAFAALRREKKKGESDSDVVTRLIREARAERKDPWLLMRAKLKRTIPPAEHLRLVKEWRSYDRDAWAEAEKRSRSQT